TTSSTVVVQVSGVASTGTVSGILVSGAIRCFDATQTLTVGGTGKSFTVLSGAAATLIAGHNIRMLPGTQAKAGSYLHAYITTNGQFCGTQAPSIPAVVSSTQEEQPVAPAATYFTVYPNPTSGNFTIEQRGDVPEGDIRADVYSMTGDRVLSADLTGDIRRSMSLGHMPDGIYFIKIFSSQHTETIKLVKSR
ncbi:MAG TPA: T9SS type A sorting domain-containing protein, partial [Bacteroidales bacterium]|nr:T9SS type A sorting domain-containing protein [Bacteroidales bacterium]